ncbi:MAG: PD-(D/E)XK nuclease family protein [Actinobacteria bacterium]|nr:PD-(D/E)XK nuclease family protein [Actinomycetota bacterium]
MSGPQLFVAPYGRPAAVLLRDRLAAAKAEDPLRPVGVLVPTNYVGVSTRRLLASGELGAVTARGTGIAGLTLLTVYRLAELLGAPTLAARGRRPISTPLLGATVRQALRDHPGIFAPVVDHPSTEQALVRAYRELSELTPDALATLAAGPVERVRHVVRIHRAVRARLVERWYDEADLMAAAARAATTGSPVLDDLGTVIVYLPDDLSLPAAALLRTLADAVRVEIVAGMTGVPDADADVLRSIERLGVAAPPPTATPPPTVHEIVSVSDAEEEVRSAVDRVLAAVRDGVSLSRIAVLYPQPEPYARILAEHLAAAGIEWNGAAVRPLADRMVGRWLLDLLDLPERDYARPAVMGLLTSAPVVRADGASLPTAAWERITRDAGVVRGRGEWEQRLTRHAEACQQRGEQPDPDAEEWMVERDLEQARRARQLATTVGTLIADLDAARRATSWGGLSAWCRRMLDRWISRRHDGWPELERDAADRVDAALDRLAGLDGVEASTDLATFRRALAAELDDDLGRVGALGSGVLVGTPGAAVGVDLDVVVALGMAEGLAPTRPREDSLLPDAARRVVGAQLRPRDERSGVEHRHLLAALAAARRRRVLVFPRGDLRRSTGQVPSRWLADAVERLAGQRTLPARAPWFEQVPSFAARVRTTPLPATARLYTLRALADAAAAAGRAASGLPIHPHIADDAELHQAATALRQRAGGQFGPFTGRLSEPAAKLAANHTWRRPVSATALEQWLGCPHAFLLRHVLGVKTVDNPEELLRISALDAGSLVHDVLDRWLRSRIAAGPPAPDTPWPNDAVAQLRSLASAALDDADQRGVTGHPVLWDLDRTRIAADLEEFIGRDDARRSAEGLTPDATELPFGFVAGAPELTVNLGDGRSVHIRGRIDRVDVTADGTVHVIDYKTGKSTYYTGLTEEDPLGGWSRLQLPIYGLAMRQHRGGAPAVHTEYWFVTHVGRGERIGYWLTDAVVAQLRAALTLIADGIDAGLYPMRPPAKPSYGSHVQCAYCDPDGLGTAQLYREWERIRTDPALRSYVTAVEPDALPDDATAPGGGGS